MEEHLERVLEASFKREYEQDENLVRSLPFFATALGVVVAIFGQIVSHMPTSGSLAEFTVQLCLVAALIGFFRILWSLFQTVRRREFIIPANEYQLIDWAVSTKQFHLDAGLSEESANDETDTAVTKFLQQQYAASADHNRNINLLKMNHRSTGITWLVGLMALSAVCVGIIFADKRVPSVEKDEETKNVAESQHTATQRSPAAVQLWIGYPPAPAAAEIPSGGAGSEVSRSSGSR